MEAYFQSVTLFYHNEDLPQSVYIGRQAMGSNDYGNHNIN